MAAGSNPAFKGQELAVVGGGDTAAEEAIYLTKYGKKVTHPTEQFPREEVPYARNSSTTFVQVHLLVRGDKLRASGAMQDRVLSHPAVEVHFNVTVNDAVGDSKGQLSGLEIHNKHTGTPGTCLIFATEFFSSHVADGKHAVGGAGDTSVLPVRGLFYGIGHQPNSHLFKGDIELDEAGYVKVREGMSTSLEGVFAAGDLQDKEWRQAITAAGSGCMAALAAERYLVSTGLIREFHQHQVCLNPCNLDMGGRYVTCSEAHQRLPRN